MYRYIGTIRSIENHSHITYTIADYEFPTVLKRGVCTLYIGSRSDDTVSILVHPSQDLNEIRNETRYETFQNDGIS